MSKNKNERGIGAEAMSEEGMSRRNFLMGAGLGAAGLMAAGAVTLTPRDIAAAGELNPNDNSGVTDDIVESTFRRGRNINMKNVEPIETVPAPDSYDYETDVLILGFGVGGTSASLTAVNQGANVIAMERAAEHNWHEHGGVHIFAIPGMDDWLQMVGLPDWSDETIQAFMSTQDYTHAGIHGESADDRKARFTYLKEGRNALMQLADTLGPAGEVHYEEIYPIWRGLPTMLPTNGNIPDHSPHYPWFHKYHPVEHAIKRYCEDSGQLQILWSTPATNLIQDETGRILGARGEDADGNPVYVKAKTTIDCIGGMGANYDMCQYYGLITELIGCHIGPVTNDGRGMRMAQGAGCGLRTLPRWTVGASEGGIDALGLGLPWTLPMEDRVVKGALPDVAVSGFAHVAHQLARQDILKVNKYGKRFHNEEMNWWPRMWTEFQQPGSRYFTIFDSNIFEQMDDLYNKQGRYGMCARPMETDRYIYINDDDIRPMWDWRDQLEVAIEDGLIFKCDTLEELADVLEINKENLLATVERYNELCAKGVDEDYGKTECLYPVKDGPFYGIKSTPAYAWQVCGGVATEAWTGRVMNQKGEYIPGFYCGSNDAGQIDGETWGQNSFMGGGSPAALIGGYISGMHAAQEALGK